MIFEDIPTGASVFIDANVLVYSYAADPQFAPACDDLLARVQGGDILGFISASILSEVGHRIMTLEACKAFGWSFAGILRQLRWHPEKIQQLVDFRKVLDDVLAINLKVLPVLKDHVLGAGDVCKKVGLLSGDGLIAFLMQSQGLTQLASNDADFDRVPGIVRYSPV